MTVLEELIDIALKACEKSRAADCQKQHHARGAALLSSSGKVGFASIIGSFGDS
jgi:hypothetical protein